MQLLKIKRLKVAHHCSLANPPNIPHMLHTLSDYYTKWVEAVALPTKEASGVANALLKVWPYFYPVP